MGPSFTQRVNNNTSNVPITWYWSSFVQPLLLWKRYMCYIPWVCVCSLRFPACNAHAPYFHLWTVRLYNIFPHYPINVTILEKKFVFLFSLQLMSETFLILGRTERHIIKNLHWASYKVPFLFLDFNETLIFSTVCRRILKYQISWKSVHWEPSPSMWTDRQTDMRKLKIVAFRNFAKSAQKNAFV